LTPTEIIKDVIDGYDKGKADERARWKNAVRKAFLISLEMRREYRLSIDDFLERKHTLEKILEIAGFSPRGILEEIS
jgi:hypothetical protein